MSSFLCRYVKGEEAGLGGHQQLQRRNCEFSIYLKKLFWKGTTHSSALAETRGPSQRLLSSTTTQTTEELFVYSLLLYLTFFVSLLKRFNHCTHQSSTVLFPITVKGSYSSSEVSVLRNRRSALWRPRWKSLLYSWVEKKEFNHLLNSRWQEEPPANCCRLSLREITKLFYNGTWTLTHGENMVDCLLRGTGSCMNFGVMQEI